MNRSTVAIFEILEKAWATQNCTLVDMKVRKVTSPPAGVSLTFTREVLFTRTQPLKAQCFLVVDWS